MHGGARIKRSRKGQGGKEEGKKGKTGKKEEEGEKEIKGRRTGFTGN